MRYLQFVLAGERDCEIVTDLLRTPVLPSAFLNDSGKLPVIELAWFASARLDLTPQRVTELRGEFCSVRRVRASVTRYRVGDASVV
ncbi:hypothetical protein [Cryobacterium sp. Y57]|uniref:hypothetical protein n=1 Tax=Cryobacterium sp. Y57 TaxID=2048287 RepID=UPI0011B04D07|nr:hypothetical protein [Cryobacterium sp. Y57]